MYDINFYRKTFELSLKLKEDEKFNKDELFTYFEQIRNKKPYVYNIETTNACNMVCEMCPRTTMMTRRVETISKSLFIRIVNQLEPHSEEEWGEWGKFVVDAYGISNEEMSENHFFLYIIPKVIQLHGYGDPLLDKNLAEYIKILNDHKFYSYFSCNPTNINIDKTIKMIDNGLDYVKYSIETVDDFLHKQIRGKASDFTNSFRKITEIIEYIERNKIKTKVVITMLDLNRKDQSEQFEKLKDAFKGLNVYIYFKSEDQQWYRRDYHGTKSIHWSEFCKHPWMSTTIKSNGEVVMCMEDFNNEIILGDSKIESLYEIWNGVKYTHFRKEHFSMPMGIKCVRQCDMKLIGQGCQ